MGKHSEIQNYDFSITNYSGEVNSLNGLSLSESAPDRINYMGRVYYSESDRKSSGNLKTLFLQNADASEPSTIEPLNRLIWEPINIPNGTPDSEIITPPPPNRPNPGPKRTKMGRPNIDRSQSSCTQCHTKETPQWRRGEKGCILCNICGLRYLRQLKQQKQETRLELPPRAITLESLLNPL